MESESGRHGTQTQSLPLWKEREERGCEWGDESKSDQNEWEGEKTEEERERETESGHRNGITLGRAFL